MLVGLMKTQEMMSFTRKQIEAKNNILIWKISDEKRFIVAKCQNYWFNELS